MQSIVTKVSSAMCNVALQRDIDYLLIVQLVKSLRIRGFLRIRLSPMIAQCQIVAINRAIETFGIEART
jgi:hypothetical protein